MSDERIDVRKLKINQLNRIVQRFQSESTLNEGLFVYVPSASIQGAFGGIRDKKSWGRSTPKSWMKAGPAWVKSGGNVWRPGEELIDFGGIFSPQIAIELARNNVRILMGSVEENRWRIAVPTEKLEAVRNLLREAREIDYIKPVSLDQ